LQPFFRVTKLNRNKKTEQMSVRWMIAGMILIVFMLFSPVMTGAAKPESEKAGNLTEAVAAEAPASEQPNPGSGVVFGRLMDEQNNEPLMYASLVLHRETDSVMVTGGISDETGRFYIEQVPFGRYYVLVNFVGYPRQAHGNIRVTRASPAYDMGTIEIKAGAALLSEVTVEASRQLMEAGLDRRVINVSQELTSTGSTALELMQNIPSVAVDFDGNVSLRGSTNVTILVDGRPSTLTGLTSEEALEQIPSEMIERIEVVTNPSVRYEPDGTSGIINVVLKKERRPGYNGMVSLNVGSDNRYNGSVNFNYNNNGFNLFGGLSGRLSDSDGFGHSERVSFLPGTDPTYLFQENDYTRGGHSYNLQLGADYDFNRYNRLTFSVSQNARNRNTYDMTEYRDLYFNMDPRNIFLRETDFDMLHGGMRYNLSYQRSFDEQYRKLSFDMDLSTRKMDRNQDYYQQLFGNGFSDPLSDMLPYESTVLDGRNWMFSLQLDYEHPLGDDRKIEVGARSYFRELDTDFTFTNLQADPGEWEDIFSNRFVYNEQVHAAYGIYSSMLGNYSLQAGMRLEQAMVNADQRTSGQTFDKNYFSWYPSLHIRRNLENNQAIQLSYSRRINRPHNRNINPFVRYNSEYDISYGNPDLDPEYINSYELGYTKYFENTTLNPAIFYRNTDGMITRYRTMNEDGITETTYENLNKGVSYGAELVASQTLTSWWRINGSMAYFRRIVQGGAAQMDVENDSYSWYGRLTNNFDFGHGWTMQINGNYNSPVVMLQGEMKEMYTVDVGMRKNVLNNNGTITLRLSDVFDTQRFRMYNYGSNFTMEMERKRTSRAIVLGFSYRINEYDRRNRERNGDDGPEDIMMEFDDFD
jgi:outer membrane receptor protein involved in Fe transport